MLLDHLDQLFLARNNSTNPSITSTAASNSTKNHVVGNHLAKMLERIIIQKPTMTKAAPEKILKAFVTIFFESLADIPDQRLSIIRKHLLCYLLCSPEERLMKICAASCLKIDRSSPKNSVTRKTYGVV